MKPKGDHRKILNVLRAAVQRRCVQTFCLDKNIGSTTLYQATDPERGNPSLATLCRIVNALGYQLYVRPRKGRNAPMAGYPQPRAADADDVQDEPEDEQEEVG